MYILSASDSCPLQQLYIEQAQLYWQKGCQEDAFITLKRCFSSCFRPAIYYKTLPVEECLEERKQCAKVCLYEKSTVFIRNQYYQYLFIVGKTFICKI